MIINAAQSDIQENEHFSSALENRQNKREKGKKSECSSYKVVTTTQLIGPPMKGEDLGPIKSVGSSVSLSIHTLRWDYIFLRKTDHFE